MKNTSAQYESAFTACREIFSKKMSDYGTSWRVLRPSSLTDQIFIKANRIRSIEQKGTQKINDDVVFEYIAMVNYSIMALIQLEKGIPDADFHLPYHQAMEWYDSIAAKAKELMEAKNHDYNEAWRDMRLSSLTDIILMKLLRIKQIEDNNGQTIISEGSDSNYYDIINYSIFALIKLDELK